MIETLSQITLANNALKARMDLYGFCQGAREIYVAVLYQRENLYLLLP
jgi:hypothetical protein